MDTMLHPQQLDTVRLVHQLQQVLVTIQALEQEQLPPGGEERKHLRSPNSQKFKDNI